MFLDALAVIHAMVGRVSVVEAREIQWSAIVRFSYFMSFWAKTDISNKTKYLYSGHDIFLDIWCL